jgi:hypothetical protein
MKPNKILKYLIEQEVRKYLKEEEEAPGKIAPVRSFEEDPINFILAKYPSLAQTLIYLLTDAYKDYVVGIYIVAPKPTTFKIVLHNGQFFYLAFLGRAYEAKVLGKRYYLLTVGEKQRAVLAIAGLLELGAPINTKGPEQETPTEDTSTAPPPADKEEIPASQKEEEKTES